MMMAIAKQAWEMMDRLAAVVVTWQYLLHSVYLKEIKEADSKPANFLATIC